MDWNTKLGFSARERNFSLSHHVQKGSRAHPISYRMGTDNSFPGFKMAGA
jgi:hypothetical protein